MDRPDESAHHGVTAATARAGERVEGTGGSRYWAVLLALSYAYYAYRAPRYLALLAGLTLAVWAVSLGLGPDRGRRRRVAAATLGVALALGALVACRFLSAASGAALVIAPLGLSFYVLRLVSYTLDVVHSRVRAERNLGVFALYVAFFPEVTAGPIDRPGDLIPQLRSAPRFDYARVTNGLKLVAWGAFKKVVVADRLAPLVDGVYRDPTRCGGIELLTATVLYAFQIYADFSAYSDIAIGLGEVLGFKLARNFDHPYVAHSISEFWRRWHISLSTWLRDYVFLPVAYAASRTIGDRTPLGVGAEYWSYMAAVAVTMTLAGAWHGFRPTFLLWGMLMGGTMAVSLATRRLRARWVRAIGLGRFPALRGALRVALTFFLVCMAWVAFRAETPAAAWYVWTHLTSGVGAYLARVVAAGWTQPAGTALIAPFLLGHPRAEVGLAVAGVAVVQLEEWVQRRWGARRVLARAPLLARWALYYALVSAILLFGVFESKTFIYARF